MLMAQSSISSSTAGPLRQSDAPLVEVPSTVEKPLRVDAPKTETQDHAAAPGEGAPVTPLSPEAPPSITEIAQLRARGKQEQRQREKLTSLATQAAVHAASVPALGATASEHPILEHFGEAFGLALGVIVTEALAFVPSWNAKLLDPSGKPVQSIEGAVRIGDHDLRKRHEEVVGPKIEAYVKTLPAGVVHDLLHGFAKGATEGPGTSYWLEAKIADLLKL